MVSRTPKIFCILIFLTFCYADGNEVQVVVVHNVQIVVGSGDHRGNVLPVGALLLHIEEIVADGAVNDRFVVFFEDHIAAKIQDY